MLSGARSLVLLAISVSAACLPPPPREPYEVPPDDGIDMKAAGDDVEALCAEGHEASCDLLREHGRRRPARTGNLRLTGMGTCFAVAPDGLLVTAQHVVDGADAVAVQFGDEAIVEATIEKSSSGVDLALLRIGRPTPRHLRIDPAVGPSLGQRVFTIGFPQPGALGLNAKFAEGTISGVTGLGEDHLVQLSVPIHQGNSGGAIVTEEGNLVAIVVAKVNDERFYRQTGSIAGAISFATKVAFLVPMLPTTVAPAAPPLTPLDRTGAIALVQDATCKVLVAQRGR
jgi:S1-C subfamily serine protease